MKSFDLSIGQLRASYLSGKASPVEVVEHLSERIRANRFNAWLATCLDQALERARSVQRLIERDREQAFLKYPLLGVPFGAKDNLVTEGLETTAGSRILKGYLPNFSATVVARAQAAGGILLGKLNMDEFGMGSSNENSAYGNVLNPVAPGRVPGGSSGGAAAAIAGGECSFAFGTDTGGSIRLPATFCGVVGHKPTYGLMSRFGVIAYASSLDQAGPMAMTVEDTEEVFRVTSGSDPYDATSISQLRATPQGLSGLKIGVPNEYFGASLDSEVGARLHEALDWFVARGAQLVQVELPSLKFALSAYYIIAMSEASSNLARMDGVRFGSRHPKADASRNLGDFYRLNRSQFGHEVKRRILLGTHTLSSGYFGAYYEKACRARNAIRLEFDRAFSAVDVILGPVSPSLAFQLGERVKDPLSMYFTDLFTVPVNLAGLPALALPVGRSREGLPIGMQLIGSRLSDSKILGLGKLWEERGSG